MLGTGLACISSLVSSVTTALFGEGTNALSTILDKGAEAVSGKNNDALKSENDEEMSKANYDSYLEIIKDGIYRFVLQAIDDFFNNHFIVLTQAEYDALGEYDPHKFYMIYEPDNNQ